MRKYFSDYVYHRNMKKSCSDSLDNFDTNTVDFTDEERERFKSGIGSHFESHRSSLDTIRSRVKEINANNETFFEKHKQFYNDHRNNIYESSTIYYSRPSNKKKITIFAFSLCLLLSVITSVYITNSTYTVNMKYNVVQTQSYNNHVGSSWIIESEFNTKNVVSSKTKEITLHRGKLLKVTTTAKELDSVNDCGEKTSYHYITKNMIDNGFFINHSVKTKENRGRYNGNSAVHEVTYIFYPVFNDY
jgi:hypothetical protein